MEQGGIRVIRETWQALLDWQEFVGSFSTLSDLANIIGPIISQPPTIPRSKEEMDRIIMVISSSLA